MSGDGPARAGARSLVLTSSHLHTNGHQLDPNGQRQAEDEAHLAELNVLEQELSTQQAVAEGAAGLLSRLASAEGETATLRDHVQAELESANQRIQQLTQEIARIASTQLALPRK